MAGIYLHIPFCKRRCIYCDFYSTTQSARKAAYIDALCAELRQRREYAGGEAVETIYFGGGTPSQLDADDFRRVFDEIFSIYKVTPEAEITLEANPDDLTMPYIDSLRTLPFNRLSMGIQTFDEERLKMLHRRHTARQAIEAFRHCREAGFRNISIDLMYGLPGESVEGWQYDLEQAVDLAPEHISAYHLIYEEGTPLWRLREEHRVDEVDEDLSVTLFARLIHTLKAHGYQHYEISNFCLPGLYSRHNSSYWTGKRYIGCGASAHSYDGKSRQWNVASLERYIQGIRSGQPAYERETLDLDTRYNDFVITTLRTMWGMPLDTLRNTFGATLADYCLRMAQPYLDAGTLQTDGHTLRLTEKGVFVSDGIMSDLLRVD